MIYLHQMVNPKHGFHRIGITDHPETIVEWASTYIRNMCLPRDGWSAVTYEVIPDLDIRDAAIARDVLAKTMAAVVGYTQVETGLFKFKPDTGLAPAMFTGNYPVRAIH